MFWMSHILLLFFLQLAPVSEHDRAPFRIQSDRGAAFQNISGVLSVDQYRFFQSHAHNGGVAVEPWQLGDDALGFLEQGQQGVAGLRNHQNIPGAEIFYRFLLGFGHTQIAAGGVPVAPWPCTRMLPTK